MYTVQLSRGGGVNLRNLGAILQLSGDNERVDADWIC